MATEHLPRSRASRKPRAVGATVAILCLLTAACSGDPEAPEESGPSESAPPQETAEPWTVPGLVDAFGEPYDVPLPPTPTGEELPVTDFGADPAPGTGDDAGALRDALAAADPGDVVVLGEGTFDLETIDPDDPTTHALLPSGVHVRGAGPDETVLRSTFGDGPEDLDNDDSAVLRGLAVEDVALSGFTVTSTYDGPLGSDPDDEDAGGGPMFGIFVGEEDDRGSRRVLVEDVAVERFQRHGISVKASREVTVRDCELSDATSVGPGGAGYGVAIEGRADQRDPDADNDSRHHVVTDNVFDGDHLRHAILLQFPTHNNLVADNTIEGSVLDAIDLHGEGEYLNEIRGNRIRDGLRAAIALGNSGGDTHEHGASGEGNWVHHNLLEDNAEGIVVILGTPDTLVERNEVRADDGAEGGIRVDDGPGTVVRDNRVLGPDDEEFEALDLPDDVEEDGNLLQSR